MEEITALTKEEQTRLYSIYNKTEAKALEQILKRLNMTIKLIQDLPFSSKERLKLKQDTDYYREQLRKAI